MGKGGSREGGIVSKVEDTKTRQHHLLSYLARPAAVSVLLSRRHNEEAWTTNGLLRRCC